MKKIIRKIIGLISLLFLFILLLIIFVFDYTKNKLSKLGCYVSPKYKNYYEQKSKERYKKEKKKLDEITKSRGWSFQDLR